ncbi:MAG: NuoI/complex I 23 kDa subunit family protein [Dehalococcoidia bacterium]
MPLYSYGRGVLQGLAVTLKNFLRPPITIQYPEQRALQHPRFRGEEFVWYEERCTGCASCAKYCPLGIIQIVTHPSETQPQEGDRYAVDVFDIEVSRCMFCGLCVEACPYDALFMGSGFERARYARNQMVIPVEELRKAERHPSTCFRPQLEQKGYNPHRDGSLPWQEVGREEWQWHQQKKAGASLPPRPFIGEEEE